MAVFKMKKPDPKVRKLRAVAYGGPVESEMRERLEDEGLIENVNSDWTRTPQGGSLFCLPVLDRPNSGLYSVTGFTAELCVFARVMEVHVGVYLWSPRSKTTPA
jgi:hypothetical protein